MTSKAALRGFVTGCSGPDTAPRKESISTGSGPTIVPTEGDWP
jgi:hypothetical protein